MLRARHKPFRVPILVWAAGVFAVIVLYPSDEQPANQSSGVVSASAYYRNCDAARAAGAAPLYRVSPGYRRELDRDGDGIACEPYRGRW